MTTSIARDSSLAADAIAQACRRIAPAWPLDRSIAVNPLWGFIDQPIAHASALVGALSGAQLVPASDTQSEPTSEPIALPSWRLMTHCADAQRDLTHAASWHEFVVQHISRCCAAYFDQGQARWQPVRTARLYEFWHEMARVDIGPRLLMEVLQFREHVRALPADPCDVIAHALRELDVEPRAWADYCTALLLSVNGWASACAFRRWDAALAGPAASGAALPDDDLIDLLAIRAAWDLLIYQSVGRTALDRAWREAKRTWPTLRARVEERQQADWAALRLAEHRYQQSVITALESREPAVDTSVAEAQVVFCIDVRSEVMRRALERVAPRVHTLGFAGFFGVPLAYADSDGRVRAQLPGLLAPTVVARGSAPSSDTVGPSRLSQLAGSSASSTFSYVEATGLAALPQMLRRIGHAAPVETNVDDTFGARIESHADGRVASDADLVSLAAGMLRGMSLTQQFAPLVALIGHGSCTTNNPQAAALACGACGGHAGDVNARVAAELLNRPAVRAGLRAQGIDVPDRTLFVAGLHETVTDEVTLFDLAQVPMSHADGATQLQRALHEAGATSRKERAPRLGLSARGPALLQQLQRRAADWSEVRPEWGLARNASLVIAPRARTRGVMLDGRSFLHEYRHDLDADGAVLTAIMTAPMVVAHWINAQYYASTVDNARYGSGDKVLHNVAGANQGVFEGAGGDLRIGLAMQSLHDGAAWVHRPLRLSVFIEAPVSRIEDIVQRHDIVRQLVDGEWLHLLAIDPDSGTVRHRVHGRWEVR